MNELEKLIVQKTKNIGWQITVEQSVISNPLISHMTRLYVNCKASYNGVEVSFIEYLYTDAYMEEVAEFVIEKVTDLFVKELFRR